MAYGHNKFKSPKKTSQSSAMLWCLVLLLCAVLYYAFWVAVIFLALFVCYQILVAIGLIDRE